jgi:hypothetical protein
MKTEELVDLWDDIVATWNRAVLWLRDAIEVFLERIRPLLRRFDVVFDRFADKALGLPPVPPVNRRDLVGATRDLRRTEAPRGLRSPHCYARRNR